MIFQSFHFFNNNVVRKLIVRMLDFFLVTRHVPLDNTKPVFTTTKVVEIIYNMKTRNLVICKYCNFESFCGINYDENNTFCVFMVSFCFEKKV